MKTVTVEQFKSFNPCWLDNAADRKRFNDIAKIRNEWTALDILRLPRVSVQDKLWAVLREELIDAPVLHEFACWCAEEGLKLIDNPDPRSTAAIAAKRAWMRKEISDEQLAAAWDAARAAAGDAARAAAWDAARAAARAAAGDAARAAAGDAARAAAGDAAGDAQVSHLMQMLKEGNT